MNKTLHLNLTKKWFDMILSGEKKEEYRAITHYWRTRICNKTGVVISFLKKDEDNFLPFKDFDTITFSNGFSKNRPQFVIELKKIRVGNGVEKWGAEKGKVYFVLELGKIIFINQFVNFNEEYLESKIELAKDTWKDINVDEYLKEIRGN